MADEQDEGGQDKRIKIGDLPVPESELTEEDEKGISGGRMQPSPDGGLRGQPTPELSQPSPGNIGQPSPDSL